MKYRTKLYLNFLVLIFFTTAFGLVLMYFKAEKYLFENLRGKVLIVAKTSAEMINGDLLKTFEKDEEVKNPAFQTLASRMRALRDANRRSDIYVIYVYTVRPMPGDPKKLEVVVDSSENPNVFAPPEEAYPEGVKIGILSHLNEPWSPEELVSDRWGKFLPGYAPIKDSQGNYVATLGVNLSAEYVMKTLDSLKLLVFGTLFSMLLAGFLFATFLSHFVTRSLETLHDGIQEIGKGNLKSRLHMKEENEFGQLAHAINDMAKGLEEHERLKINFIRYVSKHVMEKILESETPPALKGERRKVTVLFTDIRDFSRLVESLQPEEVVELLNEYLEAMLSVIFENHGTLDKFTGDGLMVEFGAPLDDPSQEKDAVKTAIEMQLALKALNRKRAAAGRPILEMGIGINTGLAVMGNIGSDKRMEYTAIGDTVNVASRLKTASREKKAAILISESVKEGLGGLYHAKDLGPAMLPGRADSIRVFAIEAGES